MKISTKGRYALRMLIDLASHNNGEFIALKEIAERQNISKKYLEQIIPVLSKSNIVITNRGFKGGYKLAKDPSKYTIGEILRLTEGSLSPVPCLDYDPIGCERIRECSTIEFWKGLKSVIDKYVDSVTLKDLIDKQNERLTNDYMI